MSTADKIDDSWPHTHGTVEGYDHGCRGGSCPAGDEYGLSCKLAKSLSRNDYRYGRLVRTGATVAEIAAEFDLVGTSTPAPAKPKPAAKTKRIPKPAPPAPDVVPPAPETEPEVVDDVAEQTPETDPAAPVTPAPPSAQEIRKWARDRGYELPSFGRIPNHIRAHYDEAHAPKAPAEVGILPAEVIDAFTDSVRRGYLSHQTQDMTEPDTQAPELDTETPLPVTAQLNGGELVIPLDPARYAAIAHPVAIAQQAGPRPEWGYVALQEDLERANAAADIALEERDRARGFAARLFDELHRTETTAAEHRERAAAALADYLRDLAEAEQARDIAEQALAAEAEGRRIAESALQLTLEKWGELKAANRSLLAFPALVEGMLR